MSTYGNRGLSLRWIVGWYNREFRKPDVEPEELAGSNLPDEQQEGAADKLVEDEAAERTESSPA